MPKRATTHKPPSTLMRPSVQPARLTRHQRGYTNVWARYSKQRLQEHPFCESCDLEGTATLGEVTDHRLPPTSPTDPLFWDPTNHQTLCKPHHDAKTAREDGGFGNVKRSRLAALAQEMTSHTLTKAKVRKLARAGVRSCVDELRGKQRG